MTAYGTEFFSMNDVNRLRILQDVIDRRLTTRLAANRLEISDRHCRRLLERYREHGPLSLVNRRRGQPGNRQLMPGLAERALRIIRERYADFGPTLACEKLAEVHGLYLAKETVRKLMTQAGLWIPRKLRPPRVHQPRPRRACTGELIQIDGCEHRWFEDRGPACTLLVYVDDATSRLMQLLFVSSESTFTYFEATRGYLERYGKPLAFYSDKASVFRINNKQAIGGDGQTQFGRAMNELNITGICANTSSAKGRVERAHLTLQDRLVKELRLRGISTPEAANAFADEFMADYNHRMRLQNISSVAQANQWLEHFMSDFNRRFSRPAKYPKDLHRPVTQSPQELNDIFAWQELRTLSKALTFQYDKIMYIVDPTEENTRIAGEKITAFDYPDGSIAFRHLHRPLAYQVFDTLACVDQGAVVDNKRLGAVPRLAQ